MEARKTQIFVVYADGDDRFCDMLINQARTAKLAVEFVHMPTKQPWVPQWKATCRTRVFQSEGAIVLITKKTQASDGLKTELAFVAEAHIPMLGIYMDQPKGAVPDQLRDVPVVDWNVAEVTKFVQSLKRGSAAAQR